jgi:hypothetical protein
MGGTLIIYYDIYIYIDYRILKMTHVEVYIKSLNITLFL